MSGAQSVATADWLPRIDFTVDHPVADVWPFVVDFTRWITDYRCDHVSGEQGKLGEVKRVTPLDKNGNPIGSFDIEVVRLVPNYRLVYRFLPLEQPMLSVDRIEGYEIFNLYEQDGRTLATYQTIARLESSQVSQEEFDAFWGPYDAATVDKWLNTYVPELRSQLAAR